MKNNLILLLVIIGIVGINSLAFGQKNDKRLADSGFQRTGLSVGKETDFAYMTYLDSLLKKKQEEKSGPLRGKKNERKNINKNNSSNHFPFNLFSPSGVTIFFQILAIIFILFLLYKLGLNVFFFSRRKNKIWEEKKENDDVKQYNVEQYQHWILDSENKEELNLAIKFYFLQVLKKLDEFQIIHFSADKTNSQYIQEIMKDSVRKDFMSLAYIYENVWYGKFAIDKIQYRHFKTQFEAFLSSIKKSN